MGLIHKQVKLIGPQGSNVFTALMDSGASESFIHSVHARMIAQPFRIANSLKLELGKGETTVDEVIFAQVELNGYRLHGTFFLVPELTEQLILGADFFQRWKIRLDPETEDIIVDPKALKIKLVQAKICHSECLLTQVALSLRNQFPSQHSHLA